MEWWDTYRGEVIRKDNVKVKDGFLSLEPPPFRRDIAMHARPAQAKP